MLSAQSRAHAVLRHDPLLAGRRPRVLVSQTRWAYACMWSLTLWSAMIATSRWWQVRLSI